MENKFTKSKKIILIIFVLLMVFIIPLVIAIALTGFYSHEDAVKYLSEFDRPTDFVVTDGYGVFCHNNKTLDLSEEFTDDKVNRIGYIDAEFIYIICFDKQYKENKKRVIYKSNFDLTENNKIFEFSSDASFLFLDSDLFYYEENKVCYTYRFSTNITEVVEDTYKENYYIDVNRYTVTRKVNAYSSETKKYYITDNITGEEKTITKSDFMGIELAQYLKDKKSFSLGKIYVHRENVFMIGRSNGVCIIFKYDFESNCVQYYSWIDDSRLYQEPRDFYFFDH